MVGSVASSSARSNQGVERFYHPPARRKQLELEQQLLQQQQQQQQQQQLQQQQQMHQQQQHPQQQQQQSQQQQHQHQQQQPSQQHPHRHHHHGSRHPHHSQQQQQQPRPARQRVRAPMAVAAAAAAAAAASVEAREAETRAVESDDSTKHSTASVSVSAPVSTAASSSIASSSSPSPPPRPPTPQGNLNQFIDSVTPLVNANYLIKPGPRGWRNTEERLTYYVLDDLWETFSEWSAYGAGVPILLNGTDSVVQYYVPYLSAIQLYVKDPSKHTPVRNSDGELYRDTSSEGSNECGADRRSMHIQEGNRRLTERLSRISLTENAHGNLEGSSSDDGEAQNSPGLLKFEYLERESPYGREPLTEKVSVLARQCPELKTYKSYELLPSSWLSVAWYPIYRIPTGPTLRDLESCFLTFHLLTPCKGIKNGYRDPGASSTRRSSSSSDGSSRIPLPVLGLASYKFRDSVWITNGLCERQQVDSLLQAADSWVRGLQVDHPDLRFFMSHSAHYWR